MSTILFHSINIKSYSYSLFVNATPAGFVLICILTFELRESLELMRNLAIIIWCNERAKCGGGPPPWRNCSHLHKISVWFASDLHIDRPIWGLQRRQIAFIKSFANCDINFNELVIYVDDLLISLPSSS